MSAYAAECARRCPTGCGEGLELLSDNLTGHRSHWLEGANEDIPCTAPTIEAWAEELAAKLAQVTAERDAALRAVGKLADCLKHYEHRHVCDWAIECLADHDTAEQVRLAGEIAK